MTEDRMPERIVVQTDGVYMYPTLQDGRHNGTEYVRRDQLDKALDALAGLLNDPQVRRNCGDDAWNAARTFLSTHRPLTDRGNQ